MDSSVDVLSDILQTLQLRGTVYFQAEFRSPWAMTLGGGQFANFHLVMGGECWVRLGDGPPLHLTTGDLVLFPHGDVHSLQDGRKRTPIPAQDVPASTRGDDGKHRLFGGHGQSTMLLCGHFEVVPGAVHPLLGSLPRLLHLPADANLERQSLSAITSLAAAETQRGEPGADAVVDRLAEVLMIKILRMHATREHDDPSFLAALGDPDLARALWAVHRDPAYRWTVGSLAQKATMSRSAFAQRFRRCVQMGPIEYVTHWRMQRAGYLLATTDKTTIEVAYETGYSSEASFARAFRRIQGHGPGQARRMTRSARPQQGQPSDHSPRRDRIRVHSDRPASMERARRGA